jgi:hypothetical protein
MKTSTRCVRRGRYVTPRASPGAIRRQRGESLPPCVEGRIMLGAYRPSFEAGASIR